MKQRARSETWFPHPIYLQTVLKPNFQHSVQHFFTPLLEISQAHTIMLSRSGIIEKRHAVRIFRALQSMVNEQKRLATCQFRGAHEDLFFYVEHQLAQLCGSEVSGYLSVARSRNDVDMALYRMVLRKELLGVALQVTELQRILCHLARTHIRTVIPVVTHTQLAQPTTLGHYLMAVAEFLERDCSRLSQSFRTVNQCPLGACVATTTGFPVNRHLLARLLAFDSVLENAYGCIASVDYLVEGVSSVSTLMVNMGRFIQDLLFWSHQESGIILLPDGFVQCSSIMPQKRNPVALEHLRVLASNALGQSQAVILGLHNTPFGDVVDAEDDIQPPVRAVFEYTHRVLALLAAVLQSAQFDAEKALSQCRDGEITFTELADWLVRQHGLPFRTAHRIVGQVASELRRQPARRRGESRPERISTLLEASSRELIGKRIRISREKIAEILDPCQFVNVRRVHGGPAPQVVERSIEKFAKRTDRARLWLERKKELLSTYTNRLATL